MKSKIIDLMPGALVKFFANPYVSGASIEDGLKTSNNLWEKYKLYSSLDLLGEAVYDDDMVRYNIETYKQLLEKLKDNKHISISLKPTSLGIHNSFNFCKDSITSILEDAKKQKIPVTIDMEDHTLTDTTLKLYTELIEDFPNLGTVLQSRLFRTHTDIENLSSYNCRIRICIGIYKEASDIAYVNKKTMKDKLINYTHQLINDGHYVEVATQDKIYINKLLDDYDQLGWKNNQIEFQQLLGVPMKSTQDEIISKNIKNRLYVPFATKWDFALPYLKRRLNNNPKMAIYVLNHIFRRGFQIH